MPIGELGRQHEHRSMGHSQRERWEDVFKIKERRCLWFAVENGVGEEQIGDIQKREDC